MREGKWARLCVFPSHRQRGRPAQFQQGRGRGRSSRCSPRLAGGASRDPVSPAAVLASFPPGCGRGGSMRSEREAGQGLGLVPGLGRGGGCDSRPMDAPLPQESPRRDTDASPNPPPTSPLPPPPLHPAPGKQREEKKTALSKVRGRERGAGRGRLRWEGGCSEGTDRARSREVRVFVTGISSSAEGQCSFPGVLVDPQRQRWKSFHL